MGRWACRQRAHNYLGQQLHATCHMVCTCYFESVVALNPSCRSQEWR